MAINDKPCGGCIHYDPQYKTVQGTRREIYGFCAKLSKYPHRNVPGKVFPPDVERVGPTEGAQMKIVYRKKTEVNCMYFMAKT